MLTKGETEIAGRQSSGRAPKPLEVRVYRSEKELEQIREHWITLQDHPNADFEYYRLIHQIRKDILRPHVVAVSRGAGPEMVVVGRIEVTTIPIGVGYATIGSIKVKRLTIVHGGVLGDTSIDNCKAVIRSIEQSLATGEADIAWLSYFGEDNPLLRMSVNCEPFWCRDHGVRTQPHRFLHLPDDVTGLYGKFSSKARKNLKWQSKKLLKEFPGEVKIARCCDSRCLDVVFGDIENIARNTYQRGLGVGFIDNNEMRERLALLARQGHLRAYVLYIASVPCAFWVCTEYRGVLYSNSMGFDRSYSKYSPGMFLILRVLEDLCADKKCENIKAVDFGLGDAQYKQVLADEDWNEACVCMYAPNWRGFRVMILRTPFNIAESLASRLLMRVGLLQKLKKRWRGRLAPRGESSARSEGNIASA